MYAAHVADPVLDVAMEVPRTRAEGPGLRYAVWVQGCPMRCPGCCNPEMLPFGGGKPRRASEVADAVIGAGVEGVSFLGGEPFAQAEGLAEVARRVRAAGLNVMVYSGYTLEALRERADWWELLAETDVLVDGPYVAERRSEARRWVGSDNQGLHLLTPAYAPDDPKLSGPQTIEIRLRQGEIELNGWPVWGARTRVLERARPKAADADDGEVLAVVDALLGRGKLSVPAAPRKASRRAELAGAVAERIGRGALRWLVEGGGHVPRTVLRDGGRVRGRAWESALLDDLDLRFSKATERLWRGALLHLPALRGEGGAREVRRRARAWIAAEDTEAGDWLLYATAWPAIARVGLGEAAHGAIRRQMCAGSPLLRLTLLLDGHDLEPLAALPAARLVECGGDRLAEAWSRRLRGSDDAVAEEAARALDAWLDALERARRLDLAGPVMRALGTLQAPRIHVEGTVEGLREARQRWGALFGVAARLDSLRERCAATRYGDAGYEEAQLFLSEHEAHLAGHAARLADIGRQLAGRLG